VSHAIGACYTERPLLPKLKEELVQQGYLRKIQKRIKKKQKKQKSEQSR